MRATILYQSQPRVQDGPPRQSLFQRLGQSFNAGGIAFFARVALVREGFAPPACRPELRARLHF